MGSKFSQNLKYLRTEKLLAQSQLAEKLSYTQSNISEWEKGTVEPRATAIIAISQFFNVSSDYLLGLEDDFGTPTVGVMHDSASLTEKEKALISAFRKLLPETQDFVLRAVGITDKKLFNKN